MQIPGQGTIAVNSYNWLAPSKMTYPGGSTKTTEYDPLQRITRITSKDPANNPLLDNQYSHDKTGNILSKITTQGTTTYGYDAISRLTTVDHPSTATQTDEAYSYDGAGNRTTSAATGASTWQYSSDNQLQSYATTGYVYDDNGNTIQKTDTSTTPATLVQSYSYDENNRLSEVKDENSVTIVQYQYDPFGRRVKNTNNIQQHTTTYNIQHKDIHYELQNIL